MTLGGTKMRFRVRFDKVPITECQLGVGLFREVHEHYDLFFNFSVKEIERYMVISLFKITIAIGIMY